MPPTSIDATAESLRTQIERAERNLERQLAWIGRHDAKSSIIASIGIAMLGVMAASSPVLQKWTLWLSICFGMSATLLVISLVFLYRGQYPRIVSPNLSLLFFGTMASLKFDEFKRRFYGLSDVEYLDDILSQAHANAIILDRKFACLKYALIALLVSAVPWAGAIYLTKTIV